MSDSNQFLQKYPSPTTSFKPIWEPVSSSKSSNSYYASESITIDVGVRRSQYSSSDELAVNRFPGLDNILSICFVVCHSSTILNICYLHNKHHIIRMQCFQFL